MIRVFHITAMIQTGLPSEFDVSKVIPYTMTLTHIKTSLRNGEGYLYLSVSPDICAGIDVGVLSDIALDNVIPKGTEVRVRGVYTGRYNLDMSADFPLPALHRADRDYDRDDAHHGPSDIRPAARRQTLEFSQ